MPDFTKRLIKHRADELAEGERFLASTFAQPLGMFAAAWRGLAGGLAGGAIGTAVVGALAPGGTRSSADGATGSESEDPTTDIPHKQVVLALTDRRLLVFGFSQIRSRPTKLLLEMPLSSVSGARLVKGQGVKALELSFSDGTTNTFDMPFGSTPDPFVKALGDLQPPIG